MTAAAVIVGLFAVLANLVVLAVWFSDRSAPRRCAAPAAARLEARRAMVDFDQEWQRFDAD